MKCGHSRLFIWIAENKKLLGETEGEEGDRKKIARSESLTPSCSLPFSSDYIDGQKGQSFNPDNLNYITKLNGCIQALCRDENFPSNNI